MSKQEVDEKTPLLDEEKGLPAKALDEAEKEAKAWRQKVWSHVHFTPGAIVTDIMETFDLDPSFGVHIEFAVRAGVCAAIFGGLLLDLNVRTRPWHKWADTLEDVITPFTLIMFYFALAKTLGGTLYNIWCIVLGQGIATFAIWVFFGLYPGGTSPDHPDHHVTAGAVGGCLVVILTLYLNMDTNIKIFVLANWVFFWMDFMNDSANVSNQGFSTGDRKGPRIKMMWQSVFACVCGFLVAVLPYPIWAQTKLTNTAKQVADELCDVWKTIAQSYWSNPDSTVYEFDELVHHVQNLKAAQNAMSAHMSESWWECFGFGSLNSTRFCCAALMETLDQDLDRLNAVLAAIQHSQGQSTPEELADHERVGKIYAPPIHRLNEATCDLLEKCTNVAIKGGASDSDKEELTKGIADVQEGVDALRDTVTSNRPNTGTSKKVLDLDYLDEYTYLFGQSHFGRSTTMFAQKLVDDVHFQPPSKLERFAYWFVPWDLFDKSVLLDPEHIRFVVRNSLAIILAFGFGYTGFPADLMKYMDDTPVDRPETAAQKTMPFGSMLPIHSAGPAFILTLMVSKFSGSAIQNTLNRVMGTILGIIFAMMIIGVFGRNWKLMVLCLGVWTTYTVMMYMDCTVNAGTFLMMGYFGANAFVSCVPASECTFADRKTSAIGLVIEGMFALAVMIVVDFIMRAPPASKQAAHKLQQCWHDLVASCRQLFDDTPNTRKNVGVIRAELNACVPLATEAGNEARYWKSPWRGTLYNHIVHRNHDLRLYMVCMHYSVAVKGVNGAPKADFFMKMIKDKEFKDIGDKLIERMEVLSKLLGIFEHEGQSRWDVLSDKSMYRNYMEEQQVLIDEFVKYVNHPEQAWLLEDQDGEGDSSSDSLERDSLTKLSMLILLIQALMEDMRKMQHSIMRE